MLRYIKALHWWYRIQNDKWVLRQMEMLESYREDWSNADLQHYEQLRHKYYGENDDIRMYYKTY